MTMSNKHAAMQILKPEVAAKLDAWAEPWKFQQHEEMMRAVMGQQMAASAASPAVLVGTYEVRKITNGYLVETTIPGKGRTLHYAEDYKAVGEFITANSVKNEIEGRNGR